jgi:exonuclease VII large subunit
LQAVSPLATLSRGYAVLTTGSDRIRAAVTSIEQAPAGTDLTAHLQDGALVLTVQQVDPDNGLPKLPKASANVKLS